MNINVCASLEVRLDRDLPPAEEWDRVTTASPWTTPFQRWGWYRAWIDNAATFEQAEPYVITVRDSGRLVAGAAMQLRTIEGAATLEPLSTPWADYHDAIADPARPDAANALQRALIATARSIRVPLAIEGAPKQGLFADSLASLATLVRSYQHHAVDLCDTAHLERIVGRREFALKRRRLSRVGDIQCRHHTEWADIEPRINAFITMHRAQWADRSHAVAPFNDGVVDLTFKAICERLAPEGTLMLTEATLNDEPIAFYLGFFWSNVYYAYRTTFDRRWYRLSPGHYMLHAMMSDLRARGINTLDFMRGNYAYKRAYGNACRDVLSMEFRPGSF